MSDPKKDPKYDPRAQARQESSRGEEKQSRQGLKFQRVFTGPGQNPYDLVEWELRTASITNEKGEVIFEQKNCEVPKFWSQLATNVVVSKYFRGTLGTPGRETSIRQLISRVADTITGWGRKDRIFASEEDADTFQAELTHILLHQYACFNSPVWFNVGIDERPQCSACFINSVEDTMESILKLARTEGMLFKYGSGTGSNLSPLRSSKELLTGGGEASGPVSFMKGFDAFAGVIKSGGRTRRAAKMVILNADHPDIMDFIRSKADEEKKAWALIDAGYDGSFTGDAYSSIFFQNSNNSVRVSDAFMEAVLADEEWSTRAVTTGEVMETFAARQMMHEISDAAHQCGDPGMQFDTTINRWHTCPASGRINASNPCSEYMFLDDTACNLASLNLLKFLGQDGIVDVETFRHVVDTLITAQEIIVDNASYPTPKIEEMSHKYRTLGLGYANLGALLMAKGLPYDSEEGRAYTGAITALMTGEAYAQSSRIARHTGPFPEYKPNEEPMLKVIGMHRDAVKAIDGRHVPTALYRAAQQSWDDALALGQEHGYRNAQVSVLAPTGTIAFMMDCDTTGVEPDIALVKYKKLVGGGMLKIVNNTVPRALKNLGYSEKDIEAIIEYIDKEDTIEGAPQLKEEHLPVFDCAFRPARGKRSIQYMGHIRMMAAAQPFISGAISKTVNMPNEVTPEDISEAYITAWKLGLKAVAIYRDGCKRLQPLNTSREEVKKDKVKAAEPKPYRKRLPDERRAITHKFSISGHEGYITVGLHEDGKPGEIFLTMAKEGSVVSGLMDSFATAISMALQYGVPLEVLVSKFSHARFEPSGFTNNKNVPFAKSIVDYIFRWLASKFLTREEQQQVGVILREPEKTGLEKDEDQDSGSKETATATTAEPPQLKPFGGGDSLTKVSFELQSDSPPCSECGSIMVRNGSCYKCLECGSTSGCS
jgi:ribonucleoside-diphosphate reductase alpha chain